MKKNKYEGFSLVEMLITTVIMGIIMILASTVLTTLIRVSIVSSDKIRARNESEFVLELLRRTVRNSDPSEVYIFRSTRVPGSPLEGGRVYIPEENKMDDDDMQQVYNVKLGEGEIGTEIQFRPYGYSNWICLGFFRESSGHDPAGERGYLLWTSGENLVGNHQSCFQTPASPGPHNYLMLLNSKYINIKDFSISYLISSDGNYIITFDILSEPINWYLATGAPVNREVFRQTVVSTEGIVW